MRLFDLADWHCLGKVRGPCRRRQWRSVSDVLPKRDPLGKNERLQNDGLRLSADRRKRGEPLLNVGRVRRKRQVTKRRAPAKRHTARKARTTRTPVARDNPNVEEFNGHPVGGEDTPATDDQQ